MRIEFGPELPGRAGGGRIPSRGGSYIYIYIPNLAYNIYQYDWYYYGDDDDEGSAEGWGAVFRSKSRIVRPARY